MTEPDSQLIKGCLKQDRRAQERLYRECFAVLMGICTRYYRNKDESVAAMNLGFLKILTNLNKKKEGVPFEPWIRRIMINTIIDEFRRSRAYRETISPVDFSEPLEQPQGFSVNTAELNSDAEDVERMLQALPPATRQVFNLFAIDGYPHADIAALLDISEGTSKWHVAAARKLLTQWLEAHKPHLVPVKAINEMHTTEQ